MGTYMADLNIDDRVWMADVPCISLFDTQLGVELEEAIINVEDVDEVKAHNMDVEEANVDDVVIPRSISLSLGSTSPYTSNSFSFSDSSDVSPLNLASFDHK